MSRRIILVMMSAAALLAPAAVASSDQVGPSSTVAYDVYRHNDDIGNHVVEYVTDADGRRTVKVDARMRVKMMFMTVFKLDHRSTELWNGDELDSIKSVTKRQGRTEIIEVEAQDEHLHLVRRSEDQREEVTLPLDTLPSSFTDPQVWDVEGEETYLVLDTLTGERRSFTLAFGGETTLELDNGQMVDTRYFKLFDDQDDRLSREFWLDDTRQVLRIKLHTSGGDLLDYRLAVG